MWAALCGDDEIVKLLLRAGADVKITNLQGKTALDLAKERDNATTVKILKSKWLWTLSLRSK